MNERTTLMICISTIMIAIIVGTTIFNITDRNLMAKNIDNAIEKGIDPTTVRCSYARENDVVCVAFASNQKEFVLQSTPSKK